MPEGRSRWTQLLYDGEREQQPEGAWGRVSSQLAAARALASKGVVPIGLLDFESLGEGSLAGAAPTFAAAALRDWTHQGHDVVFALDPALYATDRVRRSATIAIDFADGRGWRRVAWGERVRVQYASPGMKTIRVQAREADGSTSVASFPFDVRHLGTPAPDDTLAITATIPYAGTAGTGRAFVALAPGNLAITKPIVVLEGFDLDNSMSWDELYQLLDQQGLVTSLQSQGFDLVVLDFTDATTHIQRNAFVATQLLQEIEAMIPPQTDMVVVGASMGGLVGRYALAYLEQQAQPARVRTFIAFDSPHRGANIPLGVQYWVSFYATQSAEAALLRDLLNTPAALQMLVYHATTPPAAVPASDPLRVQLLSDFAAVGGYPTGPRLVAIANGSGTGTGQGFAAGAQIVRYEYSSLLARLTGNVWAVPNGGSATIFVGLIDFLFPPPEQQQTVIVNSTLPYDNAPGGTRSSMADMDAVAPPLGDIVALHGSHCFIPTVSALDVETTDLFDNLAGDPNLLARTPFDAVYFPAANEPHVSLTADNAAWLLAEIVPPTTSTAGGGAPPVALRLHPNVPNPFNPWTRLAYEVPSAGLVEIGVHDVRGRLVATLWRGWKPAGRHTIAWDGSMTRGGRAPSGVYLCSLRSAGAQATRRIVLAQ